MGAWAFFETLAGACLRLIEGDLRLRHPGCGVVDRRPQNAKNPAKAGFLLCRAAGEARMALPRGLEPLF